MTTSWLTPEDRKGLIDAIYASAPNLRTFPSPHRVRAEAEALGDGELVTRFVLSRVYGAIDQHNVVAVCEALCLRSSADALVSTRDLSNETAAMTFEIEERMATLGSQSGRVAVEGLQRNIVAAVDRRQAAERRARGEADPVAVKPVVRTLPEVADIAEAGAAAIAYLQQFVDQSSDAGSVAARKGLVHAIEDQLRRCDPSRPKFLSDEQRRAVAGYIVRTALARDAVIGSLDDETDVELVRRAYVDRVFQYPASPMRLVAEVDATLLVEAMVKQEGVAILVHHIDAGNDYPVLGMVDLLGIEVPGSREVLDAAFDDLLQSEREAAGMLPSGA